MFCAFWEVAFRTGSGGAAVGEFCTRGLLRPLFDSTVRMVGSMCSDIWADAGLVSPPPLRMTETGEGDPEWGEATRLLLFRGMLRGGMSI